MPLEAFGARTICAGMACGFPSIEKTEIGNRRPRFALFTHDIEDTCGHAGNANPIHLSDWLGCDDCREFETRTTELARQPSLWGPVTAPDVLECWTS
jgi:hypothetical protein